MGLPGNIMRICKQTTTCHNISYIIYVLYFGLFEYSPFQIGKEE